MNISIDYDDTYTKDEKFWDAFIELALDYGHDIRVVTHRHPILDDIGWFQIPVYYTNGVAKKWWIEHNSNWMPDIWIDDKPQGIMNNSDKSVEWLENWRAVRES